MVIVLFSFCGCQRPAQQQHQSTIQRLGCGGCAYSEVPVAERDELSNAIAWSIHHWIWGHIREESTDGGPLLRSPGSSDRIMQLYNWRYRTDGNDVRVGHWVGQERSLHLQKFFHRQNIKVSLVLLIYNRFYSVESRKTRRFTEIQVCAWSTVVFSRGVLLQRRGKTQVLS